MKTERFIGRCKGCGGCVRVEAPETRRVKRYLGYGRTETAVFRRIPNGTEVEGYERFFAKCLCGRHVEFKRVRGTYSEKKECNAACMSAKGCSCECQCAGENHGAGWG